MNSTEIEQKLTAALQNALDAGLHPIEDRVGVTSYLTEEAGDIKPFYHLAVMSAVATPEFISAWKNFAVTGEAGTSLPSLEKWLIEQNGTREDVAAIAVRVWQSILGIAGEKKQNILHDIDSPPVPFPEKIYDPSIPLPPESLKVLDLYKSGPSKYRNVAEATVERIIPYPKYLVWKVLLETEHLYAWTGHLEPTKALPDRFGPGTQIGDGEILDCESEKSLTFRIKTGFYVYSYAEQSYLRVNLQSTGDNSTKFILKFYLSTNHTDKLSRLIKNIPFVKGIQKKNEDWWRGNVIEENQEPLRAAARRFSYLCHDRIEHGAAQLIFLGSSHLNWHVWHYNSGQLKIASCDPVSGSMAIGDEIKKGAILGYVHDPGPDVDHEKFKNDFYIEEQRGGFIRDIEKNDGSMVESGDRLYLITDDPDTPLDVVSLPRHREVDTLIRNAGNDYNLSVVVQLGDWVNAGQLIGHISSERSDAKVEYRTQLRGQILAINSDSSHKATIVLRTPKLT